MERTQESIDSLENSNTKLPIYGGLLAGLAGSLSIMLVVLGILVFSQNDIFTAARMIATVVYGPEVETGVTPIIVGTLIHLLTGGIFGAVFAWIMPRLPRGIWVVAGLIYGEAVWLISTFILLPIVAPLITTADANFNVLLIGHVIYGLVLGIAGGTYGLLWHLPERLQSQE